MSFKPVEYISSESGHRAIGTIQSVVTTVAIIAAGLWFYHKNEHMMKLNITQSVVTHQISDLVTLVRVNLHLQNVGHVPSEISKIRISLNQVLPLNGTLKESIENVSSVSDIQGLNQDVRVPWPYLEKKKLNTKIIVLAGETEIVTIELFIPNDIKTFQIKTIIDKEGDKYVWKRDKYVQVSHKEPSN